MSPLYPHFYYILSNAPFYCAYYTTSSRLTRILSQAFLAPLAHSSRIKYQSKVDQRLWTTFLLAVLVDCLIFWERIIVHIYWNACSNIRAPMYECTLHKLEGWVIHWSNHTLEGWFIHWSDHTPEGWFRRSAPMYD